MAQLTGGPMIAGGDTSVVSATPLHPLGTRMRDASGNEYIYLKGVASTVVKSWVTYDEAHLTTLLVANAVGRVAIAMAAIVANTYGWYQIYGSGSGLVLASFADDGKIYATATAGSVDDAVVTGDLIVGAIGRSAISSGAATVELNYPFATDVLG